MTYSIKLLAAVLAVLLLAALVFRTPLERVFSRHEVGRLWTVIALANGAAFLSKFPLLFLLLLAFTAVMGAAAVKRGDVGRVGVCVLLGLVMPPIALDLGGVGGINYFLHADARRVLALALLIGPALRCLARPEDSDRRSTLRWFDLLILCYPLLQLVMMWDSVSFTTSLRTMVEIALDTWLPYYVLTRALRTADDLRFVFGCLLMGFVFAASVSLLEEAHGSNLYSGLQGFYGLHWQLTYELRRGNFLRVQAMTSEPIALATCMMFGLAFWTSLFSAGGHRISAWNVGLVMVFSLLATWSRGIWLAAALFALSWLLLGRLRPRMFGAFVGLLLLMGVLAKALALDTYVMSALKVLFGNSEADLSSIEYRRNLLDTALALIKQSPFFGVPNYAAHMQQLRQGEGIIDLVNTYVIIMLQTGLVGLVVYLAPYVLLVARLLRQLEYSQRQVKAAAEASVPRAFVALAVGALLAIFTTSMTGVMPALMLWLIALPAAWLALPDAERLQGVSVASRASGGVSAGQTAQRMSAVR